MKFLSLARVWEHVYVNFIKWPKQIKSESNEKIQSGARLSFTADKNTLIQIRSCLNVSVLFAGGFYNLGLVRICGSVPAETMVKVVDKRLEEFGIDSSREICAAISDGTPIMSCFAWKMKLVHVICMTHSIQKGIEDVLYPRSPSKAVKEGITDESDNDNEE